MADLRPWLEEGADGEIAELLAAGRPAEPLDELTRERSRRRVRALERPRRRAGVLEALPAAAGVLVWVQHAALGAGLGVVVAMTAAAPRLIEHFSAPAAPSKSARTTPRAPRVPPSTTPVPASRMPAPDESASAAPPPSVAAYPDSSKDADFELELLRIERAKSELKRDPEAALRTLRTHRAEFPNGKLSLERDFMTVSALVRLGRMVEARAYADSLRKRAPGNLYDERLRQLLADAPQAP